MVTTLAVANALLSAVAAGSAVWSARGADQPFRALKAVKAILAALYAVGITASIWQWSSDEWKVIARWIGVASIPAVWIAPDILGERWRHRKAQQVEQIILDGATGGLTE